jgi:hypothetical protein
MSGFKYELTQILTLIYQAKKDNLLTDDERKAIKEHIITSEPDLTVEMEKYNKDQDLGALVETLKLSAGLTAMSSPLDSSLLKKKKQNQRRNKKKKSEEKKVDVEEETDVKLDQCEIGNSPLIMPKTFKKTKQK